MWSTIGMFIVDRIIKAVVNAIANYLNERKEKKEAIKRAKVKVKEILSEKDPQKRAANMRNWLDG